MIGGHVIHVCNVRKNFGNGPQAAKSVWCVDRHGDEACVYVSAACPVVPGDSIWWQGREAMWTPADRSQIDVHFARYGYSFDPRKGTP